MERYSRNSISITPDEQAILSGRHVLIAGCEGLERQAGSLGFAASCVVSFQAAETVKCLLSKGNICRGQAIELDLLSGGVEEISFE